MFKKLTIKRAALKKQLTNFLNYAKASNCELLQLRERYDRAPGIWREFEEVHQEIEYLFHEEGNAQVIKEHAQNKEKYEHIYYEALAIAREKLSNASVQQSDQSSQTEGQVQFQALRGTINYQREDTLKVKFPTLTINPFHGEYDQWLTFKDAFEQGVHNKNLPNIQKF